MLLMNDEERVVGAGIEGGKFGARHPIGVVSRRTGVSLHVLRAWERRYGVVEPARTAGGQRLYSDADIERLRLLRQVTDAGRNISQVSDLPVEDLRRLVVEDAQQAAAGAVVDRAGGNGTAGYVARSLAAAARLDGEAVHGTLMRAVVSLRPAEFLDEVLMPLLREVGERWHAGAFSPAQEHVVSVASRRVVTWLVDAYESPEDGPLLLVTTVAGEQHEFGALMVAVVALDAGWRVAYLGTSLPAAEIVKSARLLDVDGVALSLVNRDGVDEAVEEAAAVRAALPATVDVMVGGGGAAARRSRLEGHGVVVLATAQDLRDLLHIRGEGVRS
ncbi:MAG TPA: MerR family transcriptional regulator [Longimicrobiales bacterium]|nr:MerR family transcriptional regulator [Longimicrobiales bacterium]